MTIMKLVRDTFLEDRILGTLVVNGKVFQTGERVWADNKKNTSCIPCGIYDVCRYWSRRFGLCLMLLDVPDRSGILIHAMNFPGTQSQGCIGIGLSRKDINNDGIEDLFQSRKALDKLLEILDNNDTIRIQISEVNKNV